MTGVTALTPRPPLPASCLAGEGELATGGGGRLRRGSLALGVAVIVALLPLVARADGEAGILVQNGDSVQTYCIAFQGESITGDQLLKAAGLSFGQFGSGNTRVLCSISDIGCFAAGDFDSCFCQCKSGGTSCTYWAFFTRQYGRSWVYSPIAFTLTRSRDGDVQGWKWGSGAPSSAPVPANVSFEQICGHAPGGGLGVATATPTVVVTATGTVSGTPSTVTMTPGSGAPAASPTVAGTAVAPDASSSGTASPAAATAAPTVTLSPSLTSAATVATQSPGVPATAEPPKQDDGGGNASLIAFGAVAATLAGGIAIALIRRRGHDA